MRLLALVFLVQPALALPDVQLNVYESGAKVGKGQYSRVELPDGGLRVRLAVKLDFRGSHAAFVTEDRFDRLGRQVHSTVSTQMDSAGAKPLQTIECDYTEGGRATVVYPLGKKTATKSFQAPMRVSRRDLSELWFVKTRPKPGTWGTYVSFDVQQGRWCAKRTRYAGRRPLKLGGRTVSANLINQTTDGKPETIYLDDQGLPLLILIGKTRMERA